MAAETLAIRKNWPNFTLALRGAREGSANTAHVLQCCWHSRHTVLLRCHYFCPHPHICPPYKRYTIPSFGLRTIDKATGGFFCARVYARGGQGARTFDPPPTTQTMYTIYVRKSVTLHFLNRSQPYFLCSVLKAMGGGSLGRSYLFSLLAILHVHDCLSTKIVHQVNGLTSHFSAPELKNGGAKARCEVEMEFWSRRESAPKKKGKWWEDDKWRA